MQHLETLGQMAGRRPSTAPIEVDLTLKYERNLLMLKNTNPAIVQIEWSATHVALYTFDTTLKSWQRKNIEGAAFIVRCSRAPLFLFLVLNRDNPEEYVLELNQVSKVALQGQYVMIRIAASPQVKK